MWVAWLAGRSWGKGRRMFVYGFPIPMAVTQVTHTHSTHQFLSDRSYRRYKVWPVWALVGPCAPVAPQLRRFCWVYYLFILLWRGWQLSVPFECWEGPMTLGRMTWLGIWGSWVIFYTSQCSLVWGTSCKRSSSFITHSRWTSLISRCEWERNLFLYPSGDLYRVFLVPLSYLLPFHNNSNFFNRPYLFFKYFIENNYCSYCC